ncbi:MAG TPA: hypothetical protein VFM01_12365 [Nakamurella sp.]|jgi:hypothetical protein|nr:hypothetical protein [Nakamurella sp.]
MERSRPGRLAAVLLIIVTGGLALLLRRRRGRRVAAGGRGPDDGGGLAGVREPRRPLPKDLVGAAAATPED